MDKAMVRIHMEQLEGRETDQEEGEDMEQPEGREMEQEVDEDMEQAEGEYMDKAMVRI
jgi:hypothetical protein